jgi:hypothetical protein
LLLCWRHWCRQPKVEQQTQHGQHPAALQPAPPTVTRRRVSIQINKEARMVLQQCGGEDSDLTFIKWPK